MTWKNSLTGSLILFSWLGYIVPLDLRAAPAQLLFEDDFNRGIPGWTAVQPAVGNYISGPMRWQFDIVSNSFLEQSNIYTDDAAASPSAISVMLINDAVAPAAFTYKARLIAGDNDAFGLIFGYQNETNFYRVTFTSERRPTRGYPWIGWNVDRKVNGVTSNLFGDGTPGHEETFVNRAGVPFDVTITVAANNVLSLTVVDDPEFAPVEYKLVESKSLPGPAGGKVGFTSWGMSGGVPRGFRITNPSLEPVALAGNPNALSNWTPVVPPRNGDNTLGGGNGGQPIWSLALGQNGNYGTLHENSDAFGGNDPEGVVDFIAPSIVAGDVNWSNYFVTARIIPNDDDGHGLLLRYKDEQNFYRIALRRQSSSSGPRKGLSIQKTVNGVWEEIYHDDPVKYDPQNVPYDISAVITGNRLQVLVVGDPTGNPQSYFYGPFDITGATVDTGKIGFFSWGMSRTEFDFVRVYAIEGVPLQVSSPFGNPDPAAGLHGFNPGTVITASVTSPFEEQPGVRRVSTGWTGLGSVPASGTGTSVTFTLNEISTINWNWITLIRVTATAGAGGKIQGIAEEWVPDGTALALTAQADPGFMFVSWSGDTISTDPVLNFTVSKPLTIEARFTADSDSDGLPDSWEQTYFDGLSATPGADPDSDGFNNLAEYQRGTDPTAAETQVATDGLSSRWINVQRDPVLPGQLIVRDFGSGFRGVWENSNDFREAVDPTFIGPDFIVPNVSFEGPRIVIRPEHWNPAWNDFTASAIFSVGDNDGNCVYFRYKDEMNWYRITVSGELNDAAWRAPFGVTVQKRFNGQFIEMGRDPAIATDPTDVSFYKRIRVTVTAQGSNFEVRVIGWNAQADPPDWAPASEIVIAFTDTDIPTGRFGVGTWGQSGGGPATPQNPVNAGVLIEDIVIASGGQEVFREDWEQAPLQNQLPAGWANPQTGAPAGDWRVSAHGTLMQVSNYGPASTGTTINPKADADGTILLGPDPGTANYYLEIGFHPFDNDGIGFVYDFTDLDNYSRVLFVSEATANGRVPQGLSVSRKSGGVWSDIHVGDASFIYQPGRPFAIEFANNNGQYRLTARDLDMPALTKTWAWNGPEASANNRFGLTCWGETDAHFTYARAFRLAARDSGELRIDQVSVSGGNLVLNISNPGGAPYDVESSSTLAPDSWSVIASNQTGAQWMIALPASSPAFYRLRRGP
ncbi:MAG: hypothetical protein AB1813_07560 [Verrucomicrobiota bacterium]